MDRGVSVSLWCEETEEDQSQEPGQGQPQGQSNTRASPQLRAAWDPSVSGHRVIQRLLQVEERYMPSMLYITLIQQDPQRREELAKWVLEVRNSLKFQLLDFPHSQGIPANETLFFSPPLQVCCDCGCGEAVFPLSVSLMDRYLSAYLSLPVSPYCLAAGCILIASKLTECDVISADALCAAAEFSFQPSDLRVGLFSSISAGVVKRLGRFTGKAMNQATFFSDWEALIHFNRKNRFS